MGHVRQHAARGTRHRCSNLLCTCVGRTRSGRTFERPACTGRHLQSARQGRLCSRSSTLLQGLRTVAMPGVRATPCAVLLHVAGPARDLRHTLRVLVHSRLCLEHGERGDRLSLVVLCGAPVRVEHGLLPPFSCSEARTSVRVQTVQTQASTSLEKALTNTEDERTMSKKSLGQLHDRTPVQLQPVGKRWALVIPKGAGDEEEQGTVDQSRRTPSEATDERRNCATYLGRGCAAVASSTPCCIVMRPLCPPRMTR